MKPILDFRTVNSLWASVLVETLVRGGVRQVVVSPGSRSTPVVLALAARDDVEAIPVLDERSAGFFALGLARATGRVVALLCTSGSAAANYWPAVVEAHESGGRVLVLTADRPPEMRACSSGQTIDLQKLFGGYVRWTHELATPEATGERLRYVRQTMRQALRWAASGPVHVNVPFRDPLVPPAGAAGLSEALVGEEFFEEAGVEAVGGGVKWVQRVTSVRGLIVAGPALVGDGEGYAARVLALARASGWPVLEDALSPVRHFAGRAEGTGNVVVVGAYDKILRDAAAARDLVPLHVIGLGAWPTSKVLREWLERAQAETVLITPDAGSRDALHGRTREIVAPVEALVVEGAPLADESYRAAWRAAEVAAAAALARPSDDGWWGEPEVTRALAAGLPDGAVVVVASSMPVRDVEYFWPVNARGRRFFFSRGANGIDGTLSTALGVAHGSDAPGWLITGDLALLHDTNGFLVAAQARGGLTVVLINNHGGGIFEHLPVAGVGAAFEKFWGTPQRVDFGKLCAAYDVPHTVVADGERLAVLLAEPAPASGLRVWEVRTDRRRDARARKARLNSK